MDTSEKTIKEQWGVTECSICFETYEDPRQLPCLHTFCLKCLEKLCEKEPLKNYKCCPLCRCEFHVPFGSVAGFATNEFIARLVQVEKLKEKANKLNTCALCEELGEEVLATSYCMECQFICAKCTIRHSKQKFSKSHKVVDSKDKPSDEELEKLKNVCCSKHMDKELEIYCYDCKVFLCIVCHLAAHNTHQCNIIEKAAEIMRGTIKLDMQVASESTLNSNSQSDKFLIKKAKFQEKVLSAEKVIRNRCKELHSLLNECEEGLVTELNKIQEKKLSEMDVAAQRKLNYSHSTDVTSYVVYGETLLKLATDIEIIKAADEMHRRVEEIKKRQTEQNQWLNFPECLEFLKAGTGREDMFKMFGDFNCQDYNDFRQSQLNPREVIEAVTVLNNDIFVIRRELNTCQTKVCVYDSISLKESRDVDVPNMKLPHYLAGCAYNKALYISDFNAQFIHKVNLTNNSVTGWYMVEDHTPFGLSVTNDNTLLVTVQIKYFIATPAFANSGVVEYTSEGQQVREIRFECSIQRASQTVQVSADYYIVCHGNKLFSTTSVGVSLINTTGHSVKFYGKEKGEKYSRQTVQPTSLAIDTRTNVIFVADDRNKQVTLLDLDFNYLGCASVHNRTLCAVSQLYYDSSSNRLFALVRDGPLIIVNTSGSCNIIT